MRSRTIVSLVVAVAVAAGARVAISGTPVYLGQLADLDQPAMQDGVHSIRFALYGDEQGGEPL